MTYGFCPTVVPSHILKLKIGAPIMVIRNVFHPRIVNRKMFVVTSHTRQWLCVAQIDGDWTEGTTYSLNRIKSQFSSHRSTITRKKFGVRLAFSGTVHKSQGETFDQTVLDIRSPFFCTGQLYVPTSIVGKTQDVLMLQKEGDTPLGSEIFHQMPVVVSNPNQKLCCGPGPNIWTSVRWSVLQHVMCHDGPVSDKYLSPLPRVHTVRGQMEICTVCHVSIKTRARWNFYSTPCAILNTCRTEISIARHVSSLTRVWGNFVPCSM